MANPDFLLEVGIDYALSLKAFEDGLTRIVGELNSKDNKIKIVPELNTKEFKAFQDAVTNSLRGIAGASRVSMESLTELNKVVTEISKKDFSTRLDFSKAFDQSADINKYKSQIKDYVKTVGDAYSDIIRLTNRSQGKSVAASAGINVAEYGKQIVAFSEQYDKLARNLNITKNIGGLSHIGEEVQRLAAGFQPLMEALNKAGASNFDLSKILTVPEAPITNAQKMSDTLGGLGDLIEHVAQQQAKQTVQMQTSMQKENATVELSNKFFDEHGKAVERASKAEEEKTAISKQLLEALQKENEALKLGEKTNWFGNIQQSVSSIDAAVKSLSEFISKNSDMTVKVKTSAKAVDELGASLKRVDLGEMRSQLRVVEDSLTKLADPARVSSNELFERVQAMKGALTAIQNEKLPVGIRNQAVEEFNKQLAAANKFIRERTQQNRSAQAAEKETERAVLEHAKAEEALQKAIAAKNAAMEKAAHSQVSKQDAENALQLNKQYHTLLKTLEEIGRQRLAKQKAEFAGNANDIRTADNEIKRLIEDYRTLKLEIGGGLNLDQQKALTEELHSQKRALDALKGSQQDKMIRADVRVSKNALADFDKAFEKAHRLKVQTDAVQEAMARLSDAMVRVNQTAPGSDARTAAMAEYNRVLQDVMHTIDQEAEAEKQAAQKSNESYRALLKTISEIGKARKGKQTALFEGNQQNIETQNRALQGALKTYREYYNLLKDSMTEEQQRRITQEFVKQGRELANLRSLQAGRQAKSDAKQAERDAESARKEAEYLAQLREQVAAINGQVQSGAIIQTIDSLYAKFNQLSGSTPQLEENLARIIDLFNILRNSSATDQQKADAMAEFARLTKEADQALNALLKTEGKDPATQQVRKKAYDDLSKSLLEIEKLKQKVGNGFQGKSSQLYKDLEALEQKAAELRDGLANMTGGAITENMDQFNQSLNNVKLNAERAGSSVRDMDNPLSMLESRLTYMISLGALIMKAVGQLKKMVTETITLDTAMTQLRVVTNNSKSDYEEYGRAVADIAKDIGASISDLVDSTTVFARLGYSLSESKELARTTAMLANVGDIDISSAQSSVTTMTKAFKDVTADNIERTMDKLVEVGNNFPISVSEIAAGIDNAGSSLSAANNTFEQSVALLTSANTAVQNISKASTGLRTISARIRRTTFDLDELGETIEEAKYQEALDILTGHGVQLTENGEYRSTYEILKDIADVWEDLTSMDQAAIAEQLAGTRQQNIFFSLVEQFGEAEKAMEAMENSTGSLQNAYDEYAESIQRHIDSFKASYTQLANTVIESDIIKNIVDAGTGLLETLEGIFQLLNKIGGILPIIIGLSTTLIYKNWAKIKDMTGLTALHNGFLTLRKNIMAATTAGTTFGAKMYGSLKSVAQALGPGGIIALTITGLTALGRAYEKSQQERLNQLESQYSASMESASDSESLYDLYAAYDDAVVKMDGTTEAKERLKKASEELAEALGYEKGAAEGLSQAYQEMTSQHMQQAASDAKIAMDTAEKKLLEMYKLGNKKNGQAFTSIFAEGAGIPIGEFAANGFNGTPLSQEERVKNLSEVYRLMVERQRELADANNTNTREYKNLSEAIDWLRPQITDLQAATKLYAETQMHVRDIMRGTTDPAKKLGQALSNLTDNEVKSLLTGEWYDDDLEVIKEVMQEYYTSPDEMRSALLANSGVVLERISQPLESAKAELERVQEEIAQQGIDINRTVFGNIDTNNRQVLEWTEDNLKRFSAELDSYKDENGVGLKPGLGSISTVLGGSGEYEGLQIAFSPILQTDEGPVLLSHETVDDYIFGLIEELNESKDEWTNEDLFELDARGIEKDGKKINGLIADIGDTAEKTSRIMHFLGKDGALALAERDYKNAKDFFDLFTEEIPQNGITNAVEKSVADLATLRDELRLAIEALEEYKEAMKGGEIDDPIKEAAEIYKGALEDILSGRKGSNRVKNTAEMLLGRDWLDSVGWDLEEAGKALQDHMWKFILDPEGTSEYDYGARVAQYIEANFDKATHGVWMQDGKFYYESFEKLTKAFHDSTAAASLFLGALQAHSVNTINSTEENMELIASFRTLKDELKSTDAAVRQKVEEMFVDGMDDFQIHDTLESLREKGVIDLDEKELHATISDVLEHLHEINEQKTEADVGIKYDKVRNGVEDMTRMLIDLVTNGGEGWNIEVGISSSGSVSSGGSQNSSGWGSGKSNPISAGGSYSKPSSAGGKRVGQNGGDTLVNELGPELISDQGRAFIANGGRPGFVRLSDNAIVFTANETKDILKGKRTVNARAYASGNVGRGSLIGRLIRSSVNARGYIMCPSCGWANPDSRSTCSHCGASLRGGGSANINNSRGTTGNANAGINRSALGSPTAFPSQNMGGAGYDIYGYDDYDQEAYEYYVEQQRILGEQILAAQRAHDAAMKALREAQEAKKKAEAEIGSKIDSTSKKTTLGKNLAGTGGGNHVGGADYNSFAEPQKVDWVAVRINRIERAIADLEKIASSGFKKLDTRLRAAKDQISQTIDQIGVMNDAYDRYIQEANSVGLADSIAALVREGSIDISKYDDDQRKQIDEYTEW